MKIFIYYLLFVLLCLLPLYVVCAEEGRDELRYNALEHEWSYERPDAELDYNEMEGSFEYREKGEKLRYNAMEGTWEYAR